MIICNYNYLKSNYISDNKNHGVQRHEFLHYIIYILIFLIYFLTYINILLTLLFLCEYSKY